MTVVMRTVCGGLYEYEGAETLEETVKVLDAIVRDGGDDGIVYLEGRRFDAYSCTFKEAALVRLDHVVAFEAS